MRIAFAYHPSLVYRPMNAASLFTDGRGMTGSEISCLMYANAMAERGHDVTWFGPVSTDGMCGKANVKPYRDDAFQEGWDAVVAWNKDYALNAPGNALRVLNVQVSEFSMCHDGWESRTDLVCPLSVAQANYMRNQTWFPAEKWHIMWNGVSLDEFKPGVKVPGRVVWASSHDRGLHHVLELWPRIRAAVPAAELHVMYDDHGMKTHAQIEDQSWLWRELNRRANYNIESLRRLEYHGVRMLGAVSRERMAKEMGQAEVLAYPLDPVAMTETFGVTVLESMASGCVPVLTDADAFGELWCEACPSIPAKPYDGEAYLAKLLSVMTDHAALRSEAARSREHAGKFTWPRLAERFEKFLETRGAEGLPKAWQ